jgi:nitrite reductase/ring-hydroxylating ferredoxin subunit
MGFVLLSRRFTDQTRHKEETMAWIHVMEEAALPEGGMVPVYPLGVHVVLARVGGTVYAVAGKCAHMACPLFIIP